jgi:hypothetical protein
MRAKEFIKESDSKTRAKTMKRYQQSSTGLNTFGRSNYDNTYDLNRVMMAVAMTDGKVKPDLDKESWAAKYNTAHPYTYVEQEMLELAYDAAGIPFEDLNAGDVRSKEVSDTQKQSPIKPFKGYKK